jgi:hypothetical protein
MEGQSPWRMLRELRVKAPQEYALLPPIGLDRISTDSVLGPGNDLLTHYLRSFERASFSSAISSAPAGTVRLAP